MGQDSTETKIDDLLFQVTTIVEKQKFEVITYLYLFQRGDSREDETEVSQENTCQRSKNLLGLSMAEAMLEPIK